MYDREERNLVLSALRTYKIEKEHWSEIHANCRERNKRPFLMGVSSEAGHRDLNKDRLSPSRGEENGGI